MKAISTIAEGSPSEIAQRIQENVGAVLRGKPEVIQLAVTALLAKGHLLVEDVPGVGKTSLARALAISVGVDFRRIQFTSDLMPADVTGGSIYDARSGEFEFRPGPIFTDVLLADEINRTTPKTQSALLEAMEERQVSIEGVTHSIGEPFFVIATQNPEDFHGTYPLPESQLDRFLLCVEIGYPSAEVERELIRSRRGSDPLGDLGEVVSKAELLKAQEAVDTIRIDELLVDYVHEIVLATRSSELLSLGASIRGALGLERAARARALVQGRDHVLPDDIKELAVPVLSHRVRLANRVNSTDQRPDAARIMRDLLQDVVVPI